MERPACIWQWRPEYEKRAGHVYASVNVCIKDGDDGLSRRKSWYASMNVRVLSDMCAGTNVCIHTCAYVCMVHACTVCVCLCVCMYVSMRFCYACAYVCFMYELVCMFGCVYA